MAYEDFNAFSQGQANQTFGAAPLVQTMADPFAPRRNKYQDQLDTLLSNPGAFESSPVFQFAYNKGMDNLRNKLAGSGMYNSGNALKAAMDYGREATSQLFYPQANLLSKLAGVDSSSPAAAALSWGNMFGRGQDQQAIAAASRSLGRGPAGGGQQQTPWWQQPMQMPTSGSQSPGWSNTGTGLPSGGYSIPASYSPYTGAGYLPSADAGTGYVMSDYGTTNFSNGGWDYQPSDFGSGYSDFGMPDNGYTDYSGSYDPFAYEE